MRGLVLILTALLILAACAPDEPSEAKELAEQMQEEADKPEADQEPEPEQMEVTEEVVQEVTEPEEMPEKEPEELKEMLETAVEEEITSPPQQRTKMYRFLDTFAEKVKGYQFEYNGDMYYVKGKRYKIILDNPETRKEVKFGDVERRLYYFDTIYMDRATKTAMAYCEGHSSQVNTQCSQLELYDLVYPVPFKDYEILLPEDWLIDYLDRTPDQWEENKYYIKSRATVFVKFNDDPEVELNFDPGTGLVLRVDHKQGDQLISRLDYEKLVANLVRDVDIIHRSKSEIPSSDPFYR